MCAVQVSPHKNCTSCSGLSIASIIKLRVHVCAPARIIISVSPCKDLFFLFFFFIQYVHLHSSEGRGFYVCGLWMCEQTWLWVQLLGTPLCICGVMIVDKSVSGRGRVWGHSSEKSAWTSKCPSICSPFEHFLIGQSACAHEGIASTSPRQRSNEWTQ